MGIAVNRITNANVYLNNKSQLGKAEEVNLPDLVAKMTEHKALGMVGTIELFSGFEKMEGDIKWSSYYPDVMGVAYNPFTFASLMIRANVETYSSQGRIAEVPLVTYLTAIFKKNSAGKHKQHENAEYPSSFSCLMLKQQIDGQDVLEFDAMANIYKVNGVDLLANYSANIGA
jgi:uncharacterized protein